MVVGTFIWADLFIVSLSPIFSAAELVDVTDLIAAQFKPDEKTLELIKEMKKIKPIPLWKLDIMMKLKVH